MICFLSPFVDFKVITAGNFVFVFIAALLDSFLLLSSLRSFAFPTNIKKININ